MFGNSSQDEFFLRIFMKSSLVGSILIDAVNEVIEARIRWFDLHFFALLIRGICRMLSTDRDDTLICVLMTQILEALLSTSAASFVETIDRWTCGSSRTFLFSHLLFKTVSESPPARKSPIIIHESPTIKSINYGKICFFSCFGSTSKSINGGKGTSF